MSASRIARSRITKLGRQFAYALFQYLANVLPSVKDTKFGVPDFRIPWELTHVRGSSAHAPNPQFFTKLSRPAELFHAPPNDACTICMRL
jgi:hypothetical protein